MTAQEPESGAVEERMGSALRKHTFRPHLINIRNAYGMPRARAGPTLGMRILW